VRILSFFVFHRETHFFFEREAEQMGHFFLGMMVGGFFGIAVMCIMQISRDQDEK